MYGYRMVPMPVVKYCLYLVSGNRCCNVVWRPGMVKLSWCVFVHRCKIYNSPRCTIRFRCYKHPRAPPYRGIDRDLLNYTKRNIPLWSFCQWIGIVADDIMAVWVACLSTNNLNGGVVSMRGRGWRSQTLKADEANLSRMYCFNSGKFSGVGAQGNFGVSVGGRVLRGHWHCVKSSPTPEFVHL